MKIVASIIITMCSLCSLAQSQKSLQIYVYPFIQKFGNLNNQYIEESHDNIDVDYLKKPGNEFGINYQQNYLNNWGWSAGVSWKNEYHLVNYRSIHYLLYGAVLNGENYVPVTSFSQEIALNSLGINLGIYRQLNDNISIGFVLHQYFPDYKNSYDPINFEKSSGSANDYGITEKVKSFYPHLSTVPELSFSVLVFKNFKITMGTRFKFWSFNDYLDINVYGSFDTTDIYDYDPTKILHKSAIKDTDLSYYFRFTYDIPVSRKK